MSERALAVCFLVVSIISTTTQGVSLGRLTRWQWPLSPRRRRVHAAMVRTAVCRVVAAAVYVGVGISTLIAQETLPFLALVVFSAVQLMWQANSVADIRLHRVLDREPSPPAETTPDGGDGRGAP